MRRYGNADRRTALLMAAAMIAVLLLSAGFILTHAEHHCTGEHCPVCRQIALCMRMLDQWSIRALLPLILLWSCMILRGRVMAVGPAGRTASPVGLRVRLND